MSRIVRRRSKGVGSLDLPRKIFDNDDIPLIIRAIYASIAVLDKDSKGCSYLLLMSYNTLTIRTFCAVIKLLVDSGYVRVEGRALFIVEQRESKYLHFDKSSFPTQLIKDSNIPTFVKGIYIDMLLESSRYENNRFSSLLFKCRLTKSEFAVAITKLNDKGLIELFDNYVSVNSRNTLSLGYGRPVSYHPEFCLLSLKQGLRRAIIRRDIIKETKKTIEVEYTYLVRWKQHPLNSKDEETIIKFSVKLSSSKPTCSVSYARRGNNKSTTCYKKGFFKLYPLIKDKDFRATFRFMVDHTKKRLVQVEERLDSRQK